MPKVQRYLKIIEKLRTNLHILAEKKSFTDPVVLSASQRLDVILNKYQKIMNNEMINRS